MTSWRRSGNARELWYEGYGQQVGQDVFLGRVTPVDGLWLAETRTGEEVARSPHMGEAMASLRVHFQLRRRRLAQMEKDAR